MGPKSRFLVQKSDFCHTTQILVNDPFLALGMTVNFPPWEQFFDFPFLSYSRFRKKNMVGVSKSLPPPTVRAPSASNSPSALSVGTKGLHGQFLDNFHLLWHEKISSHSHNFITKLSKLLWLLHTHLENIKLNKSCAHNLVGKISLICQIFWISQFSLRRKFNPAFNNINQSVFIVKCFVHIVSWTNIWFTFCHILDVSTLSLYFIPLDLPFEK